MLLQIDMLSEIHGLLLILLLSKLSHKLIQNILTGHSEVNAPKRTSNQTIAGKLREEVVEDDDTFPR